MEDARTGKDARASISVIENKEDNQGCKEGHMNLEKGKPDLPLVIQVEEEIQTLTIVEEMEEDREVELQN